ncbi:hypothetical protein NA56DRAFT_753196 [Hyaloscypha hepaticicola]|uniref:Protein kinase domain-containing protein n=1 Tax=Hyaloscypha hepaticicola TaxID=2082293 RepID=A0A2J6PQM5_9HELO|nr:hypothetical protein NA56DRAFT_753196 [Hyaloscypha hepaticicola]
MASGSWGHQSGGSRTNGEASSKSQLLLPPPDSIDASADSHASSVGAASSSNSQYSSDNTSPFTYEEQHTISKYSHFRGTEKPLNALLAMRQVLDTISENDVNGPRLFRLDSEFGLELGEGTQFRVTGPSEEFKNRLERALRATSGADQERLGNTIRSLASSVVKHARWIPDLTNRRRAAEARGEQLSPDDLTKELHSQLRSAKVEIERLRNKSYRQHDNIVKLLGWGLCLDTFEATTSLKTRIPLLILERATCDLGDFLASSTYKNTPFKNLLKICSDIGNGLGGLHAGNMTHGDMKPENVLLFAKYSADQEETTWTAKLCDFGNAESRSAHVPVTVKGKGKANESRDIESSPENANLFEYWGTPGWIPPEVLPDQKRGLLDFDSLKKCDIFVYGLIVWRIFEQPSVRGGFNLQTNRRAFRVRPIKEERSADYLPPRDRAYADAAKAIKKALETRINPSRMLIPSRLDMNRILRVLRAALQPVPRLRDPRPWKFFDEIYYPAIIAVDETPGKELEESQLSQYVRHAVIDRLSTFARRLSKRKDLAITKAHRTFETTLSYTWWLLPNFIRKSPRNIALESLFARTASFLPLGWDPSNIASLDHSTNSCYDICVFQTGFLNLCDELAIRSDRWPIDHDLYSYARIRSKFKLCCWQNFCGHHRPDHAVQVLWQERSYKTWKRALQSWPERTLPTIAWLFRGEIGEYELRMMEESEDQIIVLWSLICDAEISMDVRNQLFHLLVEKGCYVGWRPVSSSKSPLDDLHAGCTVFAKFLYSLVSPSSQITENYRTIATACAAVLQSSQLVTSRGATLSGDLETAIRRFFYKGEAPDRANADLDPASYTSVAFMENPHLTTLLHEAIRVPCYPAVEYFVQTAAIPLIVRGNSGQTPIEVAQAMKTSCRTTWQLAHINGIIGLFDKSSNSKAPEAELPLGWEMVKFEEGFSAYLESTINPQNPSFTFERPRFSLLQERQIPLGSRKSATGGLSYDFDLVRFIHKPELDQSKRARAIFDDHWYKNDVKTVNGTRTSWISEEPVPVPVPVQQPSKFRPLRIPIRRYAFYPKRDFDDLTRIADENTSLLNANADASVRRNDTFDIFFNWRHTLGMEDERAWIRIPSYVFYVSKVVLFRNYANILLIFIPWNILFRELKYSRSSAPSLLTLGVLGAIPLIETWETSAAALLNSRSLRVHVIDQTAFSIVPSCTVELCIGILALLHGDTDLVQHINLGSVLCNLLFISGCCFLAGGIFNSRTGLQRGIEQDFNTTAQDLTSTLIFTASFISAILYLISWTQSVSTPWSEVEATWFSRATSIVTLIIFGIWLVFRYSTHENIFVTDFQDGYKSDDEDEFEPELPPFASLVVAAISFSLLIQQTQSIVQALEDLAPNTRTLLAFIGIPVFLRLGKHMKAFRFALQDKLDDTLALTSGFTVTMCLFYGPLMVILSWTLGQVLTLRFDLYGTIIYVLSSWVWAYVASHGRTNWLEGIGLIIVYVSLAMTGCFVIWSV